MRDRTTDFILGLLAGVFVAALLACILSGIGVHAYVVETRPLKDAPDILVPVIVQSRGAKYRCVLIED